LSRGTEFEDKIELSKRSNTELGSEGETELRTGLPYADIWEQWKKHTPSPVVRMMRYLEQDVTMALEQELAHSKPPLPEIASREMQQV
jgi:hypothetical protein